MLVVSGSVAQFWHQRPGTSGLKEGTSAYAVMKRLVPVLVVVVAAALSSTVCGGEVEFVPPARTPRPTAEATLTPRAVVETPTVTPTAVVLPRPTAIPAAAVPATPLPTFTPIPTPTPKPRTLPEPTPTPTPTPGAGPTPASRQIPTPTPVPVTQLNLTGVRIQVNPPSQVQFVFNLRNEDNLAIVVPAEHIQPHIRIFEQATGIELDVPGTDEEVPGEGEETPGGEEEEAPSEVLVAVAAEWEEIDYTETSFFVHTAESLEQEVVFVLDFTNSMVQAKLPDGRTGIQIMMDTFFSALTDLPKAHRIGVVEFHDRNSAPGVISEPTTDRDAIRRAVSAFMTSPFDSGSSRVWDSIETAASLFTIAEDNPNLVKATIFFSDGRDTSSSLRRDDIVDIASGEGIQLYGVGIGNVFEEPKLAELVDSSGGAYFAATDLETVQSQLRLLVNDLLGQYKVSYITLRREGFYKVPVQVDFADVTGIFETLALDVSTFFGLDRRSFIGFDPPSVDTERGQAQVFVRALHVPRNIDHFRFKLDTTKTVAITLVPREDGGLLEGWELSGPDEEGFYDLSSDRDSGVRQLRPSVPPNAVGGH